MIDMGDDTNTGRTPTVSDDSVLDLIEEKLSADANPVLSTTEIADGLPIGRRATLNRLEKLTDTEALCRKNVGNGHALWWLTDSIYDSKEVTQITDMVEAKTMKEIQADAEWPMLKEKVSSRPALKENVLSPIDLYPRYVLQELRSESAESAESGDETNPTENSLDQGQKSFDNFEWKNP